MRKISKIVTALCLTIQSIVFAQNKPSIWIHTDFTSALSYTVNGSVATAVTDDSDPDDQVAMAMYLMMANKFDTRAIIVASTTRNLKFNSLDGFNKTFGRHLEL